MCGDESIEQQLCELIAKVENCCGSAEDIQLLQDQLNSIQVWMNSFEPSEGGLQNAAQVYTTVPVASYPTGTSVQEILLYLNNTIATIHAPTTLTNNAAPFQWNINTQVGNIPQAPSLTDEGGGEYTFSAGDGSADVTFLTGSGITDLSISNKTATTFDLNSSSGADVTVPAATSTEAGLFTAAEKLKLSGIATGAEVNVQSDWNAVSGDAFILNKPTIPSITGLATVTYVNTQDSAKHFNIQFQDEGNPLGTSGTANVVNFTGSAVTASRTGDAITVNITGGGGGATNLSYLSSSTIGTVESDTGTDAVIPTATTSIAGLISAADKTKLDGIVSGANLYVHPNHSGDVVSVADGATTIQAGVVSNSKLANMGANTIKGSVAGGVPSDLTPTEVKTLLAITGTEVANTAAGNIASTTVQAAINELDGEKQVNVQFQEEGTNLGTSGTVNVINFTGATVTASRSGNTLTVDVAGGGGGGATNLSVTNRTSTTLDVASDTGTDATIPEASITEAGLLIATDKVKLNNTTGTNTGDQTSIVGITGTKAQFDTAVTDGNFLYIGDISQYTDELAQDAIGAMLDVTLVYVDATPLLTRAALTGDVTASQGSNATTIANNVITNTKLAQAPANTLKGNNTGSTANEADLTASQVKTMLAIAASDVSNAPSGSIASTTVQTALNELDGEKHTNIQFQNEGTNLSTAGTVDVINFTGLAINAARVGNTLTVDVSATNGVTNLAYTASSTNGIVTSDTGTDATIPLVTGTDAGLLAPADFTKLGFITITQAVNLDTLESDTATNNAKVTNATHTGDATGATALTLATVNSNVGSFGSATQVGTFTANGKGLITAAGNVTITPAASSITGAGALTKVDDTNVTLTLGGSPTTSLLAATSLTLGWTGTLSTTRGGTGLSTLGTANQQLRVNAGGTALEYFTPVTSGGITSLNGLTGAVQTFTNDTNISIVSGGTAHVITWNGTLADNRITSSANWNTAFNNRITSLTTTGNSGAATLISNVLNIPNYTLVGLGGQPLDADLTAIAALAGTSGILRKTATDTWTLDTNAYLTANQTITLSGEATGSGTTSIPVTLSNSAVIGKVLTGFTSSTGTILPTDSILQAIQKLNGNLAAATAGGISSVSGTTNRITSTGGSNPIIDISSSYVGQSSITTLGTITTGVWNGTAIGDSYISSATTWNAKQAAYTNLTSIGALANSAGVLTNDGSGGFSYTTITGYTTEEAQDAVGAMIDSTLVYVDATPLLTRAALTGAITASQGSNTTSLGSFTLSQLNTAISDADVATGGGTATGTNTGDNAVNSLYSGLVSNATHTGDATGATALTVVGINGTLLSSLSTGILKNTTGTGVPSIAVAGDFPVLNQNTTGSAATLTTGRTISITGDLDYTSPSFDGSGNVTAAGTLATVNANVGSFGSSTQVGAFTVNAKGLITAASNVTITPAASSITGGAALTKVDDTNITLTLGGTPTTALLAGVSLTLGWTGTLADGRIASSATWNGKQAGIQFKDEGTNLGTSATVTEINFTGNGISASRTGNVVTVDVGATSGVTNLTYTSSATNGIVVSDTGSDATILAATTSIAGLMVPAQFDKLGFITVTQAVDLDTIESNTATNNAKVTNATHTGDVTGATTLTIATNIVTNTKLAQMPANTFKGNNTGSTANAADLTVAQMQAALSVDDLVTLSGVADGAVNLGTFSGTTIADNVTIKVALQTLETAFEARQELKIRTVTSNPTISATTDGTVVLKYPATVAALPAVVHGVILRIKNKTGGNISVTGHLDETASSSYTLPNLETLTLHGEGTLNTWIII